MASNTLLSHARLGELRDDLDALCVINEKLLKHAAACAHQDHPDELSQRELVAYAVATDAVLRVASFTLDKLDEEGAE